MIPNAIRTEIHQRLMRTEQEHGVRILFAIESGSRAWGFASPDSDFDVRFVYAHEPLWYQSINLEERRDVIEYPIVDEIDLNGWDIRKALRLFWKSNPGLIEWIQSPITYLENSMFRAEAVRLLPRIYAPQKGVLHYRHMAKGNYRGYLKTDTARLKKYFYVLRALLAARWIEQTGEVAPIEFEKLLSMLPESSPLVGAIHDLLGQKQQTSELGMAPAVPVLNAFIEAELAREVADLPPNPLATDTVGMLNDLFRATL